MAVALVTGAARPRGIGRATALRLATAGHDAACLDIARSYDEAPMHGTATSDDLDDVVKEIEALGRRAVAIRGDVADGRRDPARHPLGRLQTADEIAASIAWLLSEDACGVTGEALNVSAGQTMV